VCSSDLEPNMTFDKWVNGSRLHKFGVAWGEDDIPRALETLPLLKTEIELVKTEITENVIKFVKHCNTYFI
jgi:hypothetical protein